MFPIFLFLVVFSFYNWLAYELQQMSSQQRTELAATKTTPPVQSTDALPVLLESKGQALETLDLMLQTEAQEAELITLSPIHKEALLDLEKKTLQSLKIAVTETIKEPTILNHAEEVVLDDIANLKIRSARKVASALGIKQKIILALSDNIR